LQERLAEYPGTVLLISHGGMHPRPCDLAPLLRADNELDEGGSRAGGVRQRRDATATKTRSRISQITTRRLLSKLGGGYIR
jgi:hypothetical protein